MLRTKKAKLPTGEGGAIPLQLTILPLANEYTMYVIAERPTYFALHLTVHDVKDLNDDLQRAIEQVAMSSGNPSSAQRALTELAKAGKFAFERIFGGAQREATRQTLQAASAIQISSDGFLLPWDLLYDGPLEPVDVTHFWGMQHCIGRLIIQEDRPGDHAPFPYVIQTLCPHVGLIAYGGLEYVGKQEIPMLEGLHRSGSIHLQSLRPLHLSEREQELSYVKQFLAQELHIVHVACHAEKKEPVHHSYLRVSDEFPISLKDVVANGIELRENPFVLLNACLTSAINPLYTSFWAAELCKRGARGVLATDFHVPDQFAAAFSKVLYQQILAGKPFGQALQAARQHFWQQERSILGLAYALYAHPSLRIDRPH